MKILVCDDLSKAGLDVLESIPGAKVDLKLGLKEPELIERAKDADAILVRSGTKITAPIIQSAQKLRVIARAGIGYDNIDLDAATQRGVIVMNTPGSNSVTTAEHTIAMMMALVRNIPQAHKTVTSGTWDRKKFMGTELSGKFLGIIGLGNVGKEVSRRAQGLRMQILAYDPFSSPEAAREVGATLVGLEEALERADIITLHTVLNEETKYLINASRISTMKNKVRIINCARGELIDENALLDGLKSGKIAGAALDVFETEPPSKNHPLLSHEKVIVTPHLGASTDEAQEQVALAIAEQLKTYFMEDLVLNGVNVPSVSREVLQALGDYIDLAGRLGSFLGQLKPTTIKGIDVECSGEISKYDLSPITSAVLRGLLEPVSPGNVNFVNATLFAKERGIQVRESKSKDAGNFMNLIKVTLRTANEEHQVGGSVFGKKNLRITKFNQFYLEVIPQGHHLIIQNEDKPGVVGKWGTLLGKNKINISRMQVALDEDKKEALSIVNIDTPASNKVIDELRALGDIRSVLQVKL